MRHCVLAAVLLPCAVAFGWTSDIASYSAARDGSPVPSGGTLESGDCVEIVLTPPDEPESVFLTFFAVNRSAATPVRQVFEFDGMPVRFVRDLDANVWRATFVVPVSAEAREIALGDFSFDVMRYGADTHFDGEDSFTVPFALSLREGQSPGPTTALRVYDFGPADGAVLQGATAVTPSSRPAELTWVAGPQRWEKAVFGILDPLMHDWAAFDGGTRSIRFRLALPAGRWKAAAGFGGFGVQCWLNGTYQPPSFRFSAAGATVLERTGSETDRFRFREHEAEPDEDVYANYILPVLPETRFDVESDGSGVEFSLVCTNTGVKAAIDYLAVWPADDTAAAEQFDAILERRRARFNSLAAETYATDRYSLVGRSRFEAERNRIAEKVPFLAALDNPHDWVPPAAEPDGLEGALCVRAARGEKTGGAFVYRPDEDAASAVAVLRGFPDWARAKVYRLMNYRFIRGSSHENYIATNHLLEGPRPMKRGVNYTWYVRFDIPGDAPAGTWRGTVEVRYGSVVRALPAELVVYDVTLPKLDDCRIGLMGGGDGDEAQMRFAKEELGATTVHICNGRLNGAKLVRDAQGRIVGCSNIGGCSVEELDRRFKTYAKVGFPCKVPYCGPSCGGGAYPIEDLQPFTPEWTEGLAVVLRTVLAVARSNGCESVSMDLGGEIGHDAKQPDPETVKAVVRYLKLAKELEPGIEYTWRCNCIDSTTNFYPLLDYACIRGNSWNWVDRESDWGRNKRIGVYSMGGRFMNGVSAWYHGAKGSFREWLAWSHALEFNEFFCQGACGGMGHSEGMMGLKSEGGYTLTQRTEAWRAGIDDLRYLRLLDETLASAPEGAEKERMRAFRSFVRDAVRNSWVFCRFSAMGGPGRGDGGNDWPYLRMDIVREAIVRFVMAARKGEPADLPEFPSLPTVDTTTYLALDDGPLNYAGSRHIGGQLFLPSAVAKHPVTLTLTGGDIAPVALGLDTRGFRLRQVYYLSGTVNKVFALDAADLKPGTYELTLRIDGEVAAVTSLTLIRPERRETSPQTVVFTAPYADEQAKKLVNATAFDPVTFDASGCPVDADHAISFSGFDAFDDSVTLFLGGWWDFGACDFLTKSGGGRTVTVAGGARVTNAGNVSLAGASGSDGCLELKDASSLEVASLTLGWKNGSNQRSRVTVAGGSRLSVGGALNFSDTATACKKIALTGNELVVSNAGSRLVVVGTTGLSQISSAGTYGAPGGNRLLVTDGAEAELQALSVSRGNQFNVSNRVTVSKGGRLTTSSVSAGTDPSWSGFSKASWNRFEVLDGGVWTNDNVFQLGQYQFKTHSDNVLLVSNATFCTRRMSGDGNNSAWFGCPNSRIVISGPEARFVVQEPLPRGSYVLFGTTAATDCELAVENGADWRCPVPVGYMTGPMRNALVARTGGTLRFSGELVTGASQCDAVICSACDMAVRAESGGSVIVGGELVLVGLRGCCDVSDGCVEVADTLSVGCYKEKVKEHWHEMGSNCVLRLSGSRPSVRAKAVKVVGRTRSRLEIDLPSSGYAAGVATSSNPLVGATSSVAFGDDARLVLDGLEPFCSHQRTLRRNGRYVLVRAPVLTVPDAVLAEARRTLPDECRLTFSASSDGGYELALEAVGRFGLSLTIK